MYKKLIKPSIRIGIIAVLLIAGVLAIYTAVSNKSHTKEAEASISDSPFGEKSDALQAASKDASFEAEALDYGEADATGYSKIAENDGLELYLNSKNLGLRIKNKATAYIWNSTFDMEDESLNNTWEAFAKSAVSIGYTDKNNKIKQASLTSSNAEININMKKSGFRADVAFNDLNIKLALEVTLEADSLLVSIPFASIGEKEDDCKLQSITLYPFMGAVKGNELSGFMLIPDGSGALISLNERTRAAQPYVGRVYGRDLGLTGVPKRIEGDNSLDVKQIAIPVFGMNHNNQDSFIAAIEGGEEYAEINAYPAGVTTEFNWITARFMYRESYLQPIDKKGNAITVNQRDKNNFDVAVRYMLLSGKTSGYAGMARRYQNQLLDRGILTQASNKELKKHKDIPLRIEFVGADSKKQLFWREVIAAATVKQMDDILEDLISRDINNITVVASGWTRGGISGSSPSCFPFERKVGTSEEWSSFINKYEDRNIPIYMYADFVKAYDKAEGYKKSDIAQAASEQLISFGAYYYLNPASSLRIFAKQLPQLEASGINNIALGTMGDNLMSCYNSKQESDRSKTIEIYKTILDKGSRSNYALYKPNQYLWKYTDAYLDIPMDSSRLILEAEAVPFLHIVLKGYMDYYAPASNFHSNKLTETLRLVDYGAMPSYYLTYEDPVKLMDTNTQWLYSSQYYLWRDEIADTYEKVNNALKQVRGAVFEDRIALTDGVIKNTYSNGVSIIINYTKEKAEADGISVMPEDFAVIGGN